MNISDPWLTTYSGGRLFFLHPTEEDICIEDIAHGLSNICRYVGQVHTFYSVAEHSVRMTEMCIRSGLFDLALFALLHDSPEAYINDLHTDLKRLLPMYMEIEANLLGVVLRKYHVRRTLTDVGKIKRLDVTIRTAEVCSLFSIDGSAFSWELLECNYGRIRPWSPKKAERKFLKMFKKLYEATIMKELK